MKVILAGVLILAAGLTGISFAQSSSGATSGSSQGGYSTPVTNNATTNNAQ